MPFSALGLGLLLVGGGSIGFLLAVLGAGGSILLLPLLVSGASLPTREAVPLSLLVVLLLALGNLGPCLRRRQVALRPALILGLPALLGSWIGGGWVKAGAVPEWLQLAVFAAAALLAAWLLTRRRPSPLQGMPAAAGARPRRLRALQLVGQGVGVGLLTGIAGVGGGFAIVPALVLLADLPMALASGTSLLLIAANALVAFLALGHWPGSSLPLMLPLLLGGAVGAAAGQRLAPHLPEHRLRQGFAALLVGSALLTGGEAIQRQRAEGDAGAAESFSPQRALPDPAFPQASAPCPDARPPRPAVLRRGPLRG
ncbi:MAG: sulfite exporter TauE/SafE family protein [Synechococcaceae cyanobacterium]|nr:sulfite exporter TauE/SafE family protein [Synechococcaceae cyanobacterium]